MNSVCRSRRISGSRAENGSSINRICGSAANARDKPTRCFIPPDNSSGKRSPQPAKPTRSSISFAVACRSFTSTPRSSSPSDTLSATERCGNKAIFWNTIPILVDRTARSSVSDIPFTSVPSIKTRPAVGSISRLTCRISVDFPEPDRPIMQKISPSVTEKLTS